MKLTAEECKLIKSCWSKLSPEREDIGGEAMTRLFQVYPQSKIYFSHFDLCPGSNDIHRHGQKIFKALDCVINNLENIRSCLSDLSDMHAYILRVDPVNFKFLTRCLHVTMASSLRGEYTAQAYLAFDKLLCEGRRSSALIILWPFPEHLPALQTISCGRPIELNNSIMIWAALLSIMILSAEVAFSTAAARRRRIFNRISTRTATSRSWPVSASSDSINICDIKTFPIQKIGRRDLRTSKQQKYERIGPF